MKVINQVGACSIPHFIRKRPRAGRCAIRLSAGASILLTVVVSLAADETRDGRMQGPLRVLASNPRYFTDDGIHAVYLTGTHTWLNLQDGSTEYPPPGFDFDRYLQLLREHNHNFIRLWSWESAAWVWPDSKLVWFDPLPFARTGPGLAADGRPRFDLDQLHEPYFDRLAQRVAAAKEQGLYVGVMLFQGFSVSRKARERQESPWRYHPLNSRNNINGINGDPNGDGEGYETHELAIRAVTRTQESYVRKVVDTLRDMENVIYEIGNECHGESTAWQYHMIDVIRDREREHVIRHPVWISFQWDGIKGSGSDEALQVSTAEAISPSGAGYKTDPPAADGSKVVLADTDHISPADLNRADWVWKCFTRGLNPIFMDNPPIPGWLRHPALNDVAPMGDSERTRIAMGQTLRYARRCDLARMTPVAEKDECSSRFCLRNEGREYLVYQPVGGKFELRVPPGDYTEEWFDPTRNKVVASANRTVAGRQSTFAPPFDGRAVLYLHRTGSP